MDERYLKNSVEAALLAAGRPLTLEQLRELFEENACPDVAEFKAALKMLEEEYAERGIELREVSSGYRIQVRSTVSEAVSRLWQERPARYSRALLETVALIAYRQPITRSEIEDIRGVAVNPNIVRTLVERNWVRTVGHREVPGRPELLGTTREFLDYFNLKSLEDLPTLAALRDMDNVGVQLELPDPDAPPPAPTAESETGTDSDTEFEKESATQIEEESEMEANVDADADAEILTELDVKLSATDSDESEEDELEDEESPPEMVARRSDE